MRAAEMRLQQQSAITQLQVHDESINAACLGMFVLLPAKQFLAHVTAAEPCCHGCAGATGDTTGSG